MSTVKKVLLSRLVLHDDNPRFEGLLEEAEAIKALCGTEKVLELARDIVENGLSPLERFMVCQQDPEDAPEDANYIVAEGNRRLCALKLLKDPRKAPVEQRDAFKKIANNFRVPRTVEVVVEEEEAERIKWIERAHAGTLEGKGRKAWTATQKTRHFRNPRNVRGQAILDYAVSRGFLDADKTSGLLSHVVRLVGNPVMRAVLGIQTDDNPQVIYRDRPLEDFDKMLLWLLEEATKKDLGSQAKSDVIAKEAAGLETALGCTLGRLGVRVKLEDDLISRPAPMVVEGCRPSVTFAPRPPKDDDEATIEESAPRVDDVIVEGVEDEINSEAQGTSPRRPKRPQPAKAMPYSDAVFELLESLGNYKLSCLYFSISSIEGKHHIPALYAIAWSFLDSLSVEMGRPEKGNISQHWQKGSLTNLDRRALGLSSEAANSTADAFDRVRRFGNDTKHHPTAAGFDAQQLKADWALILPVLEFDLRKHLKK